MKKTVIQKATIYNGDCMEFMKDCEDNQFDLALVDPPFGIGISNNPVRQIHAKKQWDNKMPNAEYFSELMRVSKNQIIWGGNYFLNYLKSTQCILVWDKKQPFDFSLAMLEVAWTNFAKPAKMFRYSVLNEKNKIHPTQKPVALYEWLLTNYAKHGDKILDTHMGSGSIAIACNKLGFELTATELDSEYYKSACERIKEATIQQDMFIENTNLEQKELFV